MPAAGIHMTAMLRKGVHEDALIAKARAASLALYGIRRFYAGRHPRQGLQFGYGDTPVHDIHTSMQLLASLLHGQAAEDPPGHSVTTQKS